MHQPDDTLNLVEAAVFCRLHPNTLAGLAASGKAPGAKPGRAWVFIRADLLAYLRGQYVKDTPCPSTSKKAAKSGGRTSVMLGNGYVGLLERQIEARRKSAATRSR